MYFNHAFKKVFVAGVDTGAIDLKTTGTTAALAAGEIGLFDAKTYSAISAGAGDGVNQPFILAQGSYRSSDKIGPFHGGYKESIKSKVINPKYVSRIFKVSAVAPLQHVIELGGLSITCGQNYDLRLDLKGSPALRTVNHNLYKTLPAFSGCCDDNCAIPCDGSADSVDEAVVLLQWADAINGDPILSQFLLAEVTVDELVTTGTVSVSPTGDANIEISAIPDTTGLEAGMRVRGAGVSGLIVSVDSGTQVTLDTVNTVAGTGVDIIFSNVVETATYTPVTSSSAAAAAVNATLRITAAYVDTVFGDCTFSVNDHYELEPLFIYASVVDESGDPCAVRNTINSSGTGVTEVQAPRQAEGTGESLLRELILFNRYLQDPFPDGNSVDSIRKREVQGDVSLSTVTRANLYDKVCILHNVPRGYNPTGIYDDDQYLLEVYVPTGTTTTAFTNLLIDVIHDGSGNTLTLEAY